jgi:hypothetical protein
MVNELSLDPSNNTLGSIEDSSDKDCGELVKESGIIQRVSCGAYYLANWASVLDYGTMFQTKRLRRMV